MPSTRSGRSTSASESEATTSLRTRRRSEANADQPNHSRLPHITKENPIKNEVETAVDILTDARQTRSVKIESPSQISSRSTRRTRSITSGSENDFSEINSEKQSLPKRSTKAHYSKNLEEIAASPGVNEANKNDVLQEMGSPSRKRTSTCSAKSSKAAGPEAGTLTPKDELEQGIRMSSRLRKPTTRMLELLEQEQNKQEMRVRSSSQTATEGDDDFIFVDVETGSEEEHMQESPTDSHSNGGLIRSRRNQSSPEKAMTPPAKRRRNMKHDNYVDAGATVDEPRRDITPSGMQLHPHNLPPRQAQRSQIRARISNQIVVPEKPIPATAPLLTTDRSNTRVMKRIKPEDRDPRRDTESSYLEPSVSLHHDFPGDHMHERSFVYHRDVANSEGTQFYADEVPLNAVVGGYMSEKLITDQLHPGQIVVTENGQQVIYEPVEVEVDEDGNIRDQLMVGEDLIFADEIIEEDPRERVEIDTGTDGQPMTQKTDTTTKDDKNSSSEGQDEDEAPPELEPEENLAPEEIMQLEQMERGTYQETEYVEGIGEVIRVQSPGGTQQLIPVAADGDGETIYIDENGVIMEEPIQTDLRSLEFNFLDSKNICCGLCGEIVPYDLLLNEHLPTQHPEVMGEGTLGLEEIPYEEWLREKLSNEKKQIESGFRSAVGYDSISRFARSTRVLRRVSQVRVNPSEMSIAQLDIALRKKMIEKMGRKVPVTLVDKQHARCGICNAVVSLNRKFEVVHLVRHFNAWHPSAHRCAGMWKDRDPQPGFGKPLSMQDFAVIDTSLEVGDNLQCIWCGMFMDADVLAMHFSEVHPDDIEVPKCNLCLQELVINARLSEKYGDDFGVILPDEHHLQCTKFNTTHLSEAALERAIEKRLRRMVMNGEDGEMYLDGEDDDDDEQIGAGPEAYLNSRMTFGRRSKPKRHFIMPALRQAAPIGSKYVEPVTECHWKCKLCKGDILAAVISAGAIRHFRTVHPNELEDMQYELCKARLERVSDGCMEFVHPQLIECLVCNMTYALHKPYNMCRAIRHLKAKHPDMMPEYAGSRESEKDGRTHDVKSEAKKTVEGRKKAEEAEASGLVTDPDTIAMLKTQYNVDFEKVQTLEGADGERVYVLMAEGEEIDEETAQQLAASIAEGRILMEAEEADGEDSGAKASGTRKQGSDRTKSSTNDRSQQSAEKDLLVTSAATSAVEETSATTSTMEDHISLPGAKARSNIADDNPVQSCNQSGKQQVDTTLLSVEPIYILGDPKTPPQEKIANNDELTVIEKNVPFGDQRSSKVGDTPVIHDFRQKVLDDSSSRIKEQVMSVAEKEVDSS